MNNQHLTEPELQRAAENEALLDPFQKQHLEQCQNCRVKIENYKTIVTSLIAMETPAFDFDLSAQVMEALQVKKTPYNWMPVFATIFATLLIVITVAVFGDRISTLMQRMPDSVLNLALIPAIVLLLLQLIVIYRDYQRKMNNLINS